MRAESASVPNSHFLFREQTGIRSRQPEHFRRKALWLDAEIARTQEPKIFQYSREPICRLPVIAVRRGEK
jgi:hypothetical protein